MSDLSLRPSAFFDLADLAFGSVLDVERVWEALGSRLEEWLNAACPSGIETEGATVSEGAWLVGSGIRIGAGSVVEPGAYVMGPCWIGRDVQIRHGAYVRGNAIIGDGSIVGHATEVKGSIFLPGAKAGHFAYVGDSILGRDVNLGAGTKLANLRLEGDQVIVRSDGRRVPTGLRKLGAILGDGTQTGCNSVTNPGTLLGPRSRVLPCAAVGGVHGAESVLR